MLTLLSFFSFLIGLHCTGHAQQAAEWEDLRSYEYNFSAVMPGKVEKSQKMRVSESVKSQAIYSATVADTEYALVASEYSIVLDTPAAIKTANGVMRDLMLKGENAALVRESAVSLNKASGVEWSARGPKKDLWARTYAVNQFYYVMLVSRELGKDENAPLPAEAKRFFDSFKFLFEPGAPPADLPKASAQDSAKIDVDEDLTNSILGPATWREYPFDQYGFKANFPSKPKFQSVELVKDRPEMNMQLWMAGGGGLLCQAMYKPVGKSLPDEAANTIFTSILSEIATDGTKVTKESPIEFHGSPGRSFSMEDAETKGFGKMYLIGGTVYVLTVWMSPNAANEKEAARFLDSFTLYDPKAEPARPAGKRPIK